MNIRRRGTAITWAGAGAQSPGASTLGLRRAAIAVAGFSVLAFGVALLVVPVPGTSVVVFPLGLAIYLWVRFTASSASSRDLTIASFSLGARSTSSVIKLPVKSESIDRADSIASCA